MVRPTNFSLVFFCLQSFRASLSEGASQRGGDGRSWGPSSRTTPGDP